MAVMTIKTIPDPVLLKKCNNVKEIDKKVLAVVNNLIDTLNCAKEPEGAGMAAPQIGVSKNVCVVRRFLPENTEKLYVLINPRITSYSKSTKIGWEGCLSVPDTYGKVVRAKRVRVTALDENGGTVTIKASGFFARTLQHEIDHLNGILFTSKIIGDNVTEKELTQLSQQK